MALKTTAQTKEDVDEMSVRDRLWDSMNFSYGQKKEQSNAAYDKAISQQDRAALARGMARSSYAGAVRAGLLNQKVEAQNAIESEQIADYENRLYQVEQDEIANAFKEKQFDEGVRQFNENLAFQQSSFDIQQAFQEKQWAEQVNQWNKEYNYKAKSADQQLAYDTVIRTVANGKIPEASVLKRAGLTKADAKKMVASSNKISGGGYYYKKATNNTKSTKGAKATDSALESQLSGVQTGNNTTASITPQSIGALSGIAVGVKPSVPENAQKDTGKTPNIRTSTLGGIKATKK